MKVNLKTLSESLGLSQTTVSRALNGYTDVAEATRRRVKEAAASMGYQPDPLARRLATGRTDTIGMVFPFNATEFGDHRFGEVVAGLTEGLAKHNMDLNIIPTRPETELETYARIIDTRRVDAFIVGWTQVHDPRIALLLQRGFPFLAYGRTHTDKPYPWFDFDNEAGARMAVERLIGLGHRRIAIIHAPLGFNFAAQRFAGYLAALEAAGIARDDTLIADARLSRLAGYEAMHALLARPAPPTAVLIDNNLAGVGALRAVGDLQLRPGRDISLIVYDGVSPDIPLPYRVSWVEQATGERTGLKMAEQIVAVLNGKPVGRIHHLARPRLVPGETDGPLDSAMAAAVAPTVAPAPPRATPEPRPRARKKLASPLS
ncbi:substrate-binding domain-containing protein [Thauera sp.]|uniref:substrate-binding domain-containing protein n=1 Tax=Thauera sp. TaxID=1905334 RepID=UPI0025858B35|nr:substrate-binding domain-containing protein [Thauera sp.]